MNCTWPAKKFGKNVDAIPERELWRRHCILKERLIAYTRARVLASRLERKEAKDDIMAVERLLDPNVLTLGFARRFSPYKRGALIFKDLQRAIRIFFKCAATDPDRLCGESASR